LRAAAERLETELAFDGDLSLLDLPRRALLVSRTEKKISPHAPWLIALRHATEQMLNAGEVLVTGTGRVPYELPLWMSARARASAIIVMSSPGDHLAFAPEKHLRVWPAKSAKGAAALTLRDRLIGALADRATAIHVRAGGNMEAIAREIAARGGEVASPALPPTPPPTPSLKGRGKRNRSVPQQYEPIAGSHPWHYLTHFTREPDGAFPGESREEYFSWLCRGTDAPPRDAFASLNRILGERLIRASGRLMPAKAAMVCFTALLPQQAIELRRWRKGLRRWSFTPYGIAIRKEALEKIGARPVQYINKTAKTDGDSRFLQTCGEGELDWSREQEWRVPNDVKLSEFTNDDLLILTATQQEANEVSRRFNLPASAIYIQ